MKRNFKKLLAIGSLISVMTLNTAPVLAQTATFEGRSISYNKVKSSASTAYATTSTSMSDYVRATITAYYLMGGKNLQKDVTSTGKVATMATVDVTTNGYINAISSYHEAWFYINGADRKWNKYY